MKILKNDFMRLRLLPFLAGSVIRFINSTIKINYINRQIIEDLHKKGEKIIFAFWHGRQFLLVNAHRNMNIVLMTSLSKDGDLQTAVLTSFGYRCVRGSSSRNAAGALRAVVREIRSGKNCALAVDGPKGPVYEVKPGVFFASATAGAVIVPVSSSASPAKIFDKAWDKYMLPYPFSKAVVIYGEPLKINKDDDFSAAAERLKEELDKITRIADDYVK